MRELNCWPQPTKLEISFFFFHWKKRLFFETLQTLITFTLNWFGFFFSLSSSSSFHSFLYYTHSSFPVGWLFCFNFFYLIFSLYICFTFSSAYFHLKRFVLSRKKRTKCINSNMFSFASGFLQDCGAIYFEWSEYIVRIGDLVF